MNKIKGVGAIEEFDLDSSNDELATQIKSFSIEPGEFVRKYELDESGGGNIIGTALGGGLVGNMFEFENVFLVIWTCGEYIDVAVIKK